MNVYRITSRRSASRCGYALMVVLMFNVLFLMLLGVAWRQMGSVIRIATARSEHAQIDEGAVRAMARAMRMLETGRPPIGSASSYQCYTTFSTNGKAQYFLLTFTPGTDASVESWTVKVDVKSPSEIPSGTPCRIDTLN